MLLAAAQVDGLVVAVLDMQPDGGFVERRGWRSRSVTSSTTWLERMMLKGGSKMCVGTGMRFPQSVEFVIPWEVVA